MTCALSAMPVVQRLQQLFSKNISSSYRVGYTQHGGPAASQMSLLYCCCRAEPQAAGGIRGPQCHGHLEGRSGGSSHGPSPSSQHNCSSSLNTPSLVRQQGNCTAACCTMHASGSHMQ